MVSGWAKPAGKTPGIDSCFRWHEEHDQLYSRGSETAVNRADVRQAIRKARLVVAVRRKLLDREKPPLPPDDDALVTLPQKAVTQPGDDRYRHLPEGMVLLDRGIHRRRDAAVDESLPLRPVSGMNVPLIGDPRDDFDGNESVGKKAENGNRDHDPDGKGDGVAVGR
jgi:hypothetical protein